MVYYVNGNIAREKSSLIVNDLLNKLNNVLDMFVFQFAKRKLHTKSDKREKIQ